MDSGATDYMFCNKNYLTNLDLSRNDQYVLVANGMKAKINGIGECELFSKIIKDILYLDTFSTDLISIKRLTQELNCDVIFSSKHVKFQDRKIGKTISEGSLENGLYVLKPQILCAAARFNDQELWHKRLGHPSEKKN